MGYYQKARKLGLTPSEPLKASVIAAQGVAVGGAISMSGAGAPIGIGYATYSFLKGAFVRAACRSVCKDNWNSWKESCNNCGLK